jgi:hypothetical protein
MPAPLRLRSLRHVFVDNVPETIELGVLYVSMTYATAVHQCCCGCGHEVVTPLSRTDWALYFDGETVSLDPSVGNWSFRCQSHYWITRNVVEPAVAWTPIEIELARRRVRSTQQAVPQPAAADLTARRGLLARFWRWLGVRGPSS